MARICNVQNVTRTIARFSTTKPIKYLTVWILFQPPVFFLVMFKLSKRLAFTQAIKF